jgi:hypothetical protein
MHSKSFVVALFALFSLGHAATAATARLANVTNYPVGMFPNSVTSGDFNGDGKLDLAVGFYGPVGDPGGVQHLVE